MASAPTFLVTNVGPRWLRSKSNLVETEPRKLWAVKMINGFYQNYGVNLFFESQDQAEEFSRYSVYTPAQILKRAGSPDAPFTVNSVEQLVSMGAVNQFTNQAPQTDTWEAQLQAIQSGNATVWSFPNEADVRSKFSPQLTYTPQDMFGTLKSVPTDNSAAVQIAAANIQAAGQINPSAGIAAQQAAQQAANAFQAFQQTLSEAPTTIPGTDQWYTISNGGSGGYYDHQHYSAGTFVPPSASGVGEEVQWFGYFSSTR